MIRVALQKENKTHITLGQEALKHFFFVKILYVYNNQNPIGTSLHNGPLVGPILTSNAGI